MIFWLQWCVTKKDLNTVRSLVISFECIRYALRMKMQLLEDDEKINKQKGKSTFNPWTLFKGTRTVPDGSEQEESAYNL